MEDPQSVENCEFNEIRTRAASYQMPLEHSSNTTDTNSPQKSARNKVYVKCKVHNPKKKKGDSWGKDNDNCSSCIKFNFLCEFQNGKLPRIKDVLERLLTLKSEKTKQGQKVVMDSFRETATEIIIHWVYCNVYPLNIKTVIQRVRNIFADYIYIKDYPHDKKRDKYWLKYDTFIQDLNKLFDIIAGDCYRKKQEKFWEVKMTDIEINFYHNQAKCPPIGYCESFVSI